MVPMTNHGVGNWLKLNVLLMRAALRLAPLAASAAQSVSLESLLNEMVDVEAIARWPQAEFTCRQASSYDRAKVAPDKPGWFANEDNTQYIRKEENAGRQEQVMMDAAGPGTLVRFWLTADGERGGVLRIYLDGGATPVLSFPAFDLLQGDLKVGAPLAQPHPGYTAKGGGNNLYLPIPYAKHCKVTWEEQSKGARYYQINYRTYAPGTVVTTFSRPQVEAARALLEEVNRRLAAPPEGSTGKISALKEVLAAGAESSLDLPAGPGAVRALELRLGPENPEELERTLRGTIVQLTFDGEVTAWCPATDFFGSGVGINALHSWYRNVSVDGTMRCRWVMPYAQTARVTLLNVGTAPVRVTLQATTAPWTWDDRSLHFHAVWHAESGLKTPPERDWNFIRITGRGVYAGDALAIFNPVATWYGEGDEKIWVDGEAFPSHMGTGTEDYYSYSYAPKPVFQTPFNNLVRLDQPLTQGWNVMSRTRHLDTIPFRQSLQFDIELISWKPTTLTYAATTYWYAFPGATSNIKPQPDEAAQPVPTLADLKEKTKMPAMAPRKPGAIECETMQIARKSGEFPASSQDMQPWGRERWSNGAHLIAKAKSAGDFIELEVPAPDAQPKQLVLYATQAPDYGTLRFSINGKASAATFDGYAEQVQPAEPVKLGVFTPENGRFLLQVEVTGANPKARGAKFFFGLDCVVLEKL